MGLKVFDLQCANGHLFEGWFGSHEDYDSQQARGMLSCPLCQSDTIIKKLSAPRLNVGHFDAEQRSSQVGEMAGGAAEFSRATEGAGATTVLAASPEAIELAKIQATIIQQMREVVRNTENVGSRFADEARRIHEGESEERPIRGTATHEEREALAEDGIAVVALPDFLDADRLQ
jgi:hypothetical protein